MLITGEIGIHLRPGFPELQPGWIHFQGLGDLHNVQRTHDLPALEAYILEQAWGGYRAQQTPSTTTRK